MTKSTIRKENKKEEDEEAINTTAGRTKQLRDKELNVRYLTEDLQYLQRFASEEESSPPEDQPLSFQDC